ncbi:MAG: aromatic amino acid transaminase [Pseudomonadota bacterium]
MTDLMRDLEAAPPDALLSLMIAARNDDRPHKVDLSVGIYKTADGQTPVLPSVLAAEEQILRRQTSKAYESPQGNPVFCELMEELALGEVSDRRTTFMTPGGSGALFIAFRFAKTITPGASVWVSEPTWPNHRGIATGAGFPCQSYTYKAREDGFADAAAIAASLEEAKAGDIVVLQGACHNPTGIDLDADGWLNLAEFCKARGLLPLVDVAYQGFAQGLDEDMTGVRSFLDQMSEAFLCVSCSKNFGLYRDRTGALIVQCTDEKIRDIVASQVSSVVRTAYSMPPAHGAAIVAGILSDSALRARWEDEVTEMRTRLINLRTVFHSALVSATGRNDLMINRQNGMFSQLPIAPEATVRVQEEKAIYLPKSGRINIAGLNEERAEEIAQSLAPYLSAVD